MGLFRNIITRVASRIVEKSGGFEKLWSIAQEWKLKGNNVSHPYKQDVNIYKAVKAIADNVQQAEPAYYESSSKQQVESKDLDRLFNSPNRRQSFKDFIQEAAGHYSLGGEVFIRLIRSVGQEAGTSRLPAEMIVDSPCGYTQVLDDNRDLIGWRYGGKTLALDEVIHVKDFNPYDRFRGLPPTEPLKHEIDVDYRSMLYNKKFFDNDATPSLSLSTDKNLTQEQRDRLTDSFEKRHKGLTNAHRPTVLEAGLKLTAVGPTHKEMDFIEQKKFTREEILGTFRTPKALFNITESLNYATFTGQMKTFWIYCLVPILWKFEDAFTRQIVKPYDESLYFAFNLKNVPAFQEDFGSKVETGIKLFGMGFTSNEINEKLELGFDDKEWRDFWWINFGMAPAGEDQVDQSNDAAAPTKAVALPVEVEKGTLIEQKILKRFLSGQGALEARFESKMRRYLFEQRKRFIEKMTTDNVYHGKEILNWIEEDDLLKKAIAPAIERSVHEGVNIGRELLAKKSISEDMFTSDISSYIAMRVNKILGINQTTQSRIQDQIQEGVKNGEAINSIADRVRDVFNMASSRAKLIARTETAGGVNGGSLLYYRSVGVDQKAWITANDEHVRETHRSCQSQGAIDMDDSFNNGLQYPGDQNNGDAGEVCNCRCALRPIVN